MSSDNKALLYNVRGASDTDANDILDIDIKCFESAWTPERWAQVGHSHEHAISVVTYFGAVVGFAIMERPDDAKGVNLLKLAVKPAHRYKDCSLLLLAAAVDYAQRKSANHLFIVVPESTIYPGPLNVSDWLKTVGFTATKPFLKNHFTAYGEAENGVKFIAPLLRGK